MTVYFKPEHFKTSVPVAITSMLVMYTLNQSISAKLPPTSYIKFIDVWLLFGLVLPFVSFILTLIEEIVKNEDDEMKIFNLNGIQVIIFFPVY